MQTCSRCFTPPVTRRPRRDTCQANVANSMRDLTIAQELMEQYSPPCRPIICMTIHQYMIDRFQIHRNQSQRLQGRIGWQVCGETSRTLTPSKTLYLIVLPYSLVQRSCITESSLFPICRMFPYSQFGLGGPGRSARGFEMFSRQMNLISLYSAEVPWSEQRNQIAWQLLKSKTGRICAGCW